MRFFTALIFLLSLNVAQADSLKSFTSGSYAQIVKDQSGKPFIFTLWSITCPSCIKDMAVIKDIHQTQPELKIIMLSTDDISEQAAAKEILEKNQLMDVEQWIYAEDNTQKLQYEIDPKWYGELPRTYFFDKAGQRDAVSGALSKEDFLARIAKIK